MHSAGQTVPSTAQIRPEGNNTKCVGKKRFNGSVTHRLRKEHVLRPPFLDKDKIIFFFLMVICNSLLLLKSLPINVINCIKFYVNCSALTGACDWQYKYVLVKYANHLPWYIAVIVVFSKSRDKCSKMDVKWRNHRV